MLVGAGVRAGAQHHQAGGRAAARAAVRALPRQAGRRAARHDAHSGGARADRRQRADSQQRRSLVQRADGRRPVVGERDRRRLLPGAAAAASAIRRSGSRGRSAAVDLAAADVRPIRDLVDARRHAGARQAGRGVSGRRPAAAPPARRAGAWTSSAPACRTATSARVRGSAGRAGAGGTGRDARRSKRWPTAAS